MANTKANDPTPPPPTSPTMGSAKENDRRPSTAKFTNLMPGQSGSETTLWQLFRKWPRLSLWALGLAVTIILYGYDTVIVGNITSMPEFQKEYGEWHDNRYIIPSLWLSIWSVASPIGQMLGSIIGGPFQDRLGRRWSLGASSMLCAAGVAICFVSNLPGAPDGRRGTFTAGKFVEGTAIGMMLCTTQTYMSEVLPPTLRGPVLAFFPIFTLVGQLLGAIAVFTSLNYPGNVSFRVPFASQWPFSAVTVVLAWILPESPVWLLRCGRIEKATQCQQRLRDDADEVIEELQETLRHESEDNSKTFSYLECFRGVDRRRTLIVIFANLLPQIFGLKLLSLVSYFMQVVGMDADLSLIMLIVGIIIGIIANVASLWTLKSFGRRPLCISTLVISAVFWASMGVAGCFEGQAVVWYTAASLIIVTLVCGMGVWPASYSISSETSSLRVRALTQGIGWFSNGLATTIFGIILPYMFNPDSGNLRGKTGFFYTACCMIGAAVSWLCVPEMKDRTAADIDAMFLAKIPARQFSGYVPNQS